jgi:nucleotide-binding universal stress UspA family protein
MTYRVLCAYQPSPSGDNAFEFARDLARRFDGELFVLSVFQPAEDAWHSEPAALEEAAHQEFAPAFELLRSRVADLLYPTQFDVSIGYPALHVLSEAARLRVQHIVVGADTQRPSLDPSAAQRIAALADCAVTIMR